MRFTDTKFLPLMLITAVLDGCNGNDDAHTDTSPGSTGTTTAPAVTTSSAGTMEPTSTGTTADDIGTANTSSGASATATSDTTEATSTSLDPGTSTEDPHGTTGTTTGSTTDVSTSSTSNDTTSGGDDTTTAVPEPPPCFPKQVPWAQPCQAEFDGVQTLANIPNSAYGIAVDETHVYFTDYSPPGSPKLHRVSKCGGAVETLASAGSNPCRIEMDHTAVYISDLVNNGAIYRVSKFNGSQGVVAANLQQTCPSVVATEDAILFTGHQEPGIWKVTKFWGGQPELAHDTGQKYPGWIDTDGVYVYWNQTWNDAVERISLAGGPSQFVSDDLGHYPFEVSCEHVYGNSLISPGFWRVPVTGGPPEKVALESAHRSVMGDTHMYFTSGGSHRIIEVPLAGGAPTVVADIGNPGLLAVDATHIFWSDPDSPVIRVAPRPKL